MTAKAKSTASLAITPPSSDEPPSQPPTAPTPSGFKSSSPDLNDSTSGESPDSQPNCQTAADGYVDSAGNVASDTLTSSEDGKAERIDAAPFKEYGEVPKTPEEAVEETVLPAKRDYEESTEGLGNDLDSANSQQSGLEAVSTPLDDSNQASAEECEQEPQGTSNQPSAPSSEAMLLTLPEGLGLTVEHCKADSNTAKHLQEGENMSASPSNSLSKQAKLLDTKLFPKALEAQTDLQIAIKENFPCNALDAQVRWACCCAACQSFNQPGDCAYFQHLLPLLCFASWCWLCAGNHSCWRALAQQPSGSS